MFKTYTKRVIASPAWPLLTKYLLFDIMHATIRLAGSFFTHLIRVAHNRHHAAIAKIMSALRASGVDVQEHESGRRRINVNFAQASFILDTADTWIELVTDGAKQAAERNPLTEAKFGTITKRTWAIMKVRRWLVASSSRT